MGACVTISKYLLFLFNILFWVAGVGSLGLGIYLKVHQDADPVVTVAGVEFYYAACYILISVGSLMFLLGFLGCCGAIKENSCLLGIYFTFLLILVFVQLGIGIWGLVNRETIEEDIQKALNSSTPLEYSADNAYVQSVISVENTFKCCGLLGGCKDWTGGEAHGCSCDASADDACVAPSSLGCTNAEESGAGIYPNNCYHSIHAVIMDHVGLVIGVAVGIGLLEIFGMIFSIVICRNRKKNYEDY